MENSSFDSFDLQLSDAGRHFLRSIGKWATFLSIIGFIFIAFMLLAGLGFLMSGNEMQSDNAFGGMGMGVLGGMYVLFALVYFMPVFYLFQFATKIRRAFQDHDGVLLNEALESLKSHYKFMGIFTIIFLSLYIIGIVGAIVFGLSGMM